MTTVCIAHLDSGQSAIGQAACLIVSSQGDRVIARELLDVGNEDAINWSWRSEATRRVFQREEPSPQERVETAKRVAPLKGSDIGSGEGLGLAKHRGTWALYHLEFEGERVTAMEVFDSNSDRLWAWERLADVAERYLLGDRRPR